MEARTEATRRVARPEVIVHGVQAPPRGWLTWLTTTDHKRIGIMYLVLTVLFLLLGGVEALIMRLSWAGPTARWCSPRPTTDS